MFTICFTVLLICFNFSSTFCPQISPYKLHCNTPIISNSSTLRALLSAYIFTCLHWIFNTATEQARPPLTHKFPFTFQKILRGSSLFRIAKLAGWTAVQIPPIPYISFSLRSVSVPPLISTRVFKPPVAEPAPREAFLLYEPCLCTQNFESFCHFVTSSTAKLQKTQVISIPFAACALQQLYSCMPIASFLYLSFHSRHQHSTNVSVSRLLFHFLEPRFIQKPFPFTEKTSRHTWKL